MIKVPIAFENMNEEILHRLSNILKLKTTDLALLQPEIFPDMKNEDDITGYTVFFKEGADQAILNQVPGLDDHNSVSISVKDMNQYTTV